MLSALVCERVLVEQDGVKSLIRIVDRITHSKIGADPPLRMPPFAATLHLLIKLKSGDFKGPAHLLIRLVNPSGGATTPASQQIEFGEEPDHGIDFLATIQVQFEEEGVYWFEIRLDDRNLTRVPLRISYLRRVHDASTPSDRVQ